MTDAFGEEIREFQMCAAKFNHTNSVTELYNAIKKCIPRVKSGIYDQYFYRSLYAVQIYNCQRFINSDQFLFLSNEELRLHPLTTVKSVLQFIGVADSHYFDDKEDILRSPEAIQDAVNSHFPSFEDKAGWRLKSDYAAIPLALQRYLKTFYGPYNELLFKMIERNYSDYWDN